MNAMNAFTLVPGSALLLVTKMFFNRF